MVDQLTNYAKFEGSNPSHFLHEVKMTEKRYLEKASISSTVVELVTNNPKFEGLNQVTACTRCKRQEKLVRKGWQQ